MFKLTDDYNSFANNKQIVDDENNKLDLILKPLPLSTPGGVSLLSLIGLKVWTTLNPLFL